MDKPIDPRIDVGHVHTKLSDSNAPSPFTKLSSGSNSPSRWATGGVPECRRLPSPHRPQHLGESWCPAPPPGTTGLYHFAIRYPHRLSLADALLRLDKAGIALYGASHHGVSERCTFATRTEMASSSMGLAACWLAARCQRRLAHGDRAAQSDSIARRGRRRPAPMSPRPSTSLTRWRRRRPRSPRMSDSSSSNCGPNCSTCTKCRSTMRAGLRIGSRTRRLGRALAPARHQRPMVRLAALPLGTDRSHRRGRRPGSDGDDGGRERARRSGRAPAHRFRRRRHVLTPLFRSPAAPPAVGLRTPTSDACSTIRAMPGHAG